MAYNDSNNSGENQSADITTLQISGDTVNLPDESFVRDAEISRDGMALVLEGPNGEIIVEDYFAAADAPDLIAPNGATLTPELVNSFSKSPPVYAENATMNDASPVGEVQEISGEATITRTDGTSEPLSLGSPIYQGDVIETAKGAAVNVEFSDDSSFAVSEDTRLAIDEYVFDPSSEAGVQNFSVLKGVFVFTSGLIGRDDPDDVSIDTPVGSIGIRGTIIAGDVDKGEITVVEGAIVLRTPSGQELTLDNQFETGKFLLDGSGIKNLGQLKAQEVSKRFSTVSKVAPGLFSSINDAANEGKSNAEDKPAEQKVQDGDNPVNGEGKEFDADGATDQDGDNQVDGTVEESGTQTEETKSLLDTEEQKLADTTQTTQQIINTITATGEQSLNDAGFQIGPNDQIQKISGEETNQETFKTLKTLDPVLYDGGISDTGTKEGNGYFIAVQLHHNNEDVSGNTTITTDLKVATLTSQNKPIGVSETMVLEGSDASRFTVVETSAGSGVFEVFLKAGQQYDFESLYNLNLSFKATATGPLGSQIRTGGLSNVGVLDVNESTYAESVSGSGATLGFIKAEGSVTIDIKHLFYDQDFAPGGITEDLDFTLSSIGLTSGGSLASISGISYTFDQENGLLTLNFDSTATNQNLLDDLYLNITATDTAGHTATGQFTYTVAGVNEINTLPINTTFTSGVAGEVYTTDTATNSTTRIRSSGISIFTSDQNDTINIDNSGDNVTLNTAGGADTVVINNGADNATVVTGEGNDRIHVNGSSGSQVYAMEGSDEIFLNGVQINNMQISGLASLTLDGGRGDDTLGLGLADGANINFTAIRTQGHDISNIEVIDARNNNGGLTNTNTVSLNYSDVLAMTDDRNILRIEVDSNDTVAFDTETQAFTDLGVDGAYHAYQVGDVTLMVETGATVNIDGSSSTA